MPISVEDALGFFFNSLNVFTAPSDSVSGSSGELFIQHEIDDNHEDTGKYPVDGKCRIISKAEPYGHYGHHPQHDLVGLV